MQVLRLRCAQDDRFCLCLHLQCCNDGCEGKGDHSAPGTLSVRARSVGSLSSTQTQFLPRSFARYIAASARCSIFSQSSPWPEKAATPTLTVMLNDCCSTLVDACSMP